MSLDQQEASKEISLQTNEHEVVSNSAIHEIPSLENLASKVYHSKVVRAVDMLISSDALYEDKQSRWEPLKFDTDKAVEVLEGLLEKEFVDNKEAVAPLDQAELQLLIYKHYNTTVADLQQRGLIPLKLMQLIESRMVKLDKIRVTNHATSHMNWNEVALPTSAENGADFMVGTGCIQMIEKRLASAAEQAGMSLLPEQLREAGVRMVLSHEYGHATDMSVRLLRSEQEIAALPQGSDFKAYFDARNYCIEPTFTQRVAKNDEIDAAFEEERSEAWDTSMERIAVGFENVTLRKTLTEAGLSEEQIEAFLLAKQEDEHIKAQEYRELFKKLHEHGYSIKDTRTALNRLKAYLQYKSPELFEQIQYNFGGTVLGYFYPLSENQLKDYMDTFYDEEKIDTKLEEGGVE